MISSGIKGLQAAGIPADLTSLAHMGFGAVSFSALVVFLPITSVSLVKHYFAQDLVDHPIGIASIVH